MRNLYKLQKDGYILGLTNIVFEKDRPHGACQFVKQVGTHHHAKNIMTTTRPLKMLHMDLFGLIAYISIGGNKYDLSLLMIILVSVGCSFCKIKVKLKRY
jgi:hypothetical protein